MGLVAAVDFTLGAATLLGLLSSSSAAVAAAGVSKECPEGNGFFPDDLYCDVYYECSNGVEQEHLCKDGYVFKPDAFWPADPCHYTFSVDCTGREELQPAKPKGMCPRQNGRFAHPEKCEGFIECIDGEVYETACTAGLVFDAKIGNCNYIDKAKRPECLRTDFDCKQRAAELRENPVKRFAIEDECRWFYICDTEDYPSRIGCPEFQIFNPETQLCSSQTTLPDDHPCRNYYNETEAIEAQATFGGTQAFKQGGRVRVAVQQRKRPGDVVPAVAEPNLSTAEEPIAPGAVPVRGANVSRTRVRRPEAPLRPLASDQLPGTNLEVGTTAAASGPLDFKLADDEAIQKFRDSLKSFLPEANGTLNGGRLTVLPTDNFRRRPSGGQAPPRGVQANSAPEAAENSNVARNRFAAPTAVGNGFESRFKSRRPPQAQLEPQRRPQEDPQDESITFYDD